MESNTATLGAGDQPGRRLRSGWTAIPSGLFQDRALRSAAAEVKVFLVAAWLYANLHESDGLLTNADLRVIGAEANLSESATRAAVQALLAAGWMSERGMDYMVS